MKNILFVLCCTLTLFASCKKEAKDKNSIFGTYVGKTRLIGVGTPVPYDTIMDQTFVISNPYGDKIWIEDKGLFGRTGGFICDPAENYTYYGGCDSSETYRILPETKMFIVTTRFTAGMGGMIHTQFAGYKVNN